MISHNNNIKFSLQPLFQPILQIRLAKDIILIYLYLLKMVHFGFVYLLFSLLLAACHENVSVHLGWGGCEGLRLGVGGGGGESGLIFLGFVLGVIGVIIIFWGLSMFLWLIFVITFFMASF